MFRPIQAVVLLGIEAGSWKMLLQYVLRQYFLHLNSEKGTVSLQVAASP